MLVDRCDRGCRRRRLTWCAALFALVVAAACSSHTPTAPSTTGGTPGGTTPGPGPVPPASTGTTDSNGNVTLTVPGAGDLSVQVIDPAGAAIPQATVAVAGSDIGVGATGYIPAIVLDGANTSRTRTTSIRSRTVQIAKAFHEAVSCAASGVLDDAFQDATGVDPNLLSGVQFGMTTGPVIGGYSPMIARTVALNSPSEITSLLQALPGLPEQAGCLVQFISDGVFDLTNQLNSLTGFWYPGQVSDYVTVTADGVTVITPFIVPVASSVTAAGHVTGSTWSGPLSWSVPDRLFKTEHARFWTGGQCSGSPADDFPIAGDPSAVFGSLSFANPPQPSSEGVVASLATGSYSWEVVIDQLDGRTSSTSVCFPLNAEASSTPTAVIGSISPRR